jgi:hypothetical protein
MINALRTHSAVYSVGALLLRIATGFTVLTMLSQAVLGGDPITVVVLPPAQTAAPKDTIASANVFCDQLAAELVKDAEVRVVDRTQIDRVLAERAISGDVKPALAYDALIRVGIDPLPDKPAFIVRVIDLSTGNIGGSREWTWTPEVPPDRAREIAKACKEWAIKAMTNAQGKLKLRLLGVSTPSGMDRLQPMREDFQHMVEQVVAQNPKVCAVQHLEALTAKEESLLLLLGHAQLAGGRQFTPHADRLLSVELVETDAQGKTFDDTTIEVRFRLGKNGQEGDWRPVRGKVADWSKLAPQACQLLAEELGQAKPETTVEYVTEMITRRRQAEAELKAAIPPYGSGRKPDLERVAAAAKLDPTYEEAAYRLVNAKRPNNMFAEGAVPEVIQYLERFPYSKHRVTVMTSLTAYRGDKPAENLLETEVNKKIIDIGMEEDIHRYISNCGFMVEATYRGWLAHGGDRTQCNQWLESIKSRVDTLGQQVSGFNDIIRRPSVEASLLRVRALLVVAAFESGDKMQARQRLKEYMTCGRWISKHAETAGKVRATVVAMADTELLAEYDGWLNERTTPIEQIKLTWDDYPVYQGICRFDKILESSAMLPLAAGPHAVYGVSGAAPVELSERENRPSRQQLLSGPINAEGGPSRNAVPLTLPTLNSDLAVTGAIFHAGALYVSTKHSGLLAYDVAADKWNQISPKQGLPDWYVDSVHPLDQKTILVAAGDPGAGRVSFNTFDIATNQIKLINRLDGHSSELIAPIGVWRHGDQLRGITYVGLIQDVLQNPRLNMNWPDARPYGWPRPADRLTSMAVVGGKRYVMSWRGLHEIDENAKVLRSWWTRATFRAGSRDPADLAQDLITTPGDFPSDSRHSDPSHGSERTFITQSKGHLFLVNRIDGILCYEPTSDSWFGPLLPEHEFPTEWPLGTADGLWIGSDQGCGYTRTDDFLQAAKAAGRVMTTAEVRRRKQELAEEAGPLAAARFEVSLHNFDNAKGRVETFLASNPDDPQALALMAVLNDFWCFNRPDEAITWYRRLSALESNLSAVYTGLYGEFRINFTLGRWEEAIQTGECLLNKVPCLGGRGVGSPEMASTVESFIASAREKRDRAAQKAKGVE